MSSLIPSMCRLSMVELGMMGSSVRVPNSAAISLLLRLRQPQHAVRQRPKLLRPQPHGDEAAALLVAEAENGLAGAVERSRPSRRHSVNVVLQHAILELSLLQMGVDHVTDRDDARQLLPIHDR